MKFVRQNILPVIAALIWGLAFSAQSQCAALGIEPFTFNMSRSLIAAVVLFFVCVIFAKGFKNLGLKLKEKNYFKNLLLGGFLCGLALFCAANAQQAAFSDETESGKVGFITVLYIVLVPIFSIAFKKKASLTVWISVFIALIGMYFLCVEGGESFTINTHDLLALLCAIIFSFHILLIDKFAQKVDGVHLSFMQFTFVTLFSFICMLLFENPSFALIKECYLQILYVGVFSSGVAYTLQIIAQKDSNPTVVSLLLSLESVFAVLGGVVFLNEQMSEREYIGCAIMFLAVIFAQLPSKKQKKENNNEA